jgi:hypothetical protein
MLDLSQFHNFDDLSAEQLEVVRQAFANRIVAFASTCRTNKELLDGVMVACDPDKGLLPPHLLGAGSTRRAWSLPFGLVLKLQRDDHLDEQEMTWRGSKAYLHYRRRCANLAEAVMSARNPGIAPRVYGFLGAFGRRPTNPSLLIGQCVPRTLADLRPGASKGVSNDDLFVHSVTGELLVLDPRFRTDRDDPTQATPANRLDRFMRNEEAGYFLSNLGVDEHGRRYLVDLGNRQALTADFLAAPALLEALGVQMTSQPTLGQTVSFSESLMGLTDPA